ncbi:MAG: methyl-accepting chemotaxis protein, partial [Elsteraceae bacterium]
DRLGQQAFTILNGVILTAIAGENFKLAAVLGLANGDLAATRIAGLNYLTSTNVELLEDGKSSMEALRESLDQAEAASDAHGRSEVKKVQDLLPRYEAAFNEAAEAIAATDKIRRDLLAGLAEAVEMELNGLAISQNEVVEAITREVRGVIEANLERLGVITVAAILIGLIIQSAISVGITGPIRLMTGAMGKLAAGDLTAEIPAKANRDELGAMAQSIQIFKDNGLRVVALEAEQKEIAARADAEKRAAMERLANDFELSVNGVVLAVTESAEQLQASATQMSSTAQETKRQVRAVANASEQASTNVQTAASAAEELSSSISEIGRQVEHSTNIAGKAVQDVARTGETVQALADAAQRIGNVVNLISEIASQTNLLALNATIEAARAGEAGKGFAVVAAEVKNLAAQTARATSEISGQVAAIQSATGASVEAMQGIGATIDEMREIAASIAAAVEQQGAATQEIARNVQEAAAGADEVSGGVHGVTQAAEETGAASQEVQNLAQTLGDQSAMLRQEVESFLELVRAA